MEVIGSIYTGVTAAFQRGVYPIARCVKAEQHDLGVVMADVNVLGLKQNLRVPTEFMMWGGV